MILNRRLRRVLVVFSISCLVSLAQDSPVSRGAEPKGVLVNEFLYDSASFRSCHASTIEETPGGLVAACFGGTDEGEPDVGIWFARRDAARQKWSAPVEVANGVESKAKRYPCWNPVLYQQPGGALLLFYKVGPTPKSWWGMLITSGDGGLTWTPLTATALPNPDSGIDAVNLKDGRMLLVFNPTQRGRSPLSVAISSDGRTWQAALDLETERGEFSYPAVICTADGKAHITYTWKRKKIKHVELDPAQLTLRPMP